MYVDFWGRERREGRRKGGREGGRVGGRVGGREGRTYLDLLKEFSETVNTGGERGEGFELIDNEGEVGEDVIEGGIGLGNHAQLHLEREGGRREGGRGGGRGGERERSERM